MNDDFRKRCIDLRMLIDKCVYLKGESPALIAYDKYMEKIVFTREAYLKLDEEGGRMTDKENPNERP